MQLIEQYQDILMNKSHEIFTLLDDSTVQHKEILLYFQQLNLIQYDQFDRFIIQKVQLLDDEVYTTPTYYSIKSFHFKCFDRETKSLCNLKIIEVHRDCISTTFRQYLKQLINFQVHQFNCIDLPIWPIYANSSKSNDQITQIIIPSSFNCFSLQDVLKKKKLMKDLCQKQKIFFEDYLGLMIAQTLFNLSQLHKQSIAHRNIQPYNIIYQVQTNQWKLRNIDQAHNFSEQNYQDYFDIVGHSKYLNPELNKIREKYCKEQIQSKKVFQNLFQNDLYALAVSVEKILTESTHQIHKFLQLLKKITNLSALEFLINHFNLYNNEKIAEYHLTCFNFYGTIAKKQIDSQILNNKWTICESLISKLIKNNKPIKNLPLIHIVEEQTMTNWKGFNQLLLENDFSHFKINKLIRLFVYCIEKPLIYQKLNLKDLQQTIQIEKKTIKNSYLILFLDFNQAAYFLFVTDEIEKSLIILLRLKKEIIKFQQTREILQFSYYIQKLILICYEKISFEDEIQFANLLILQKRFELHGIQLAIEEITKLIKEKGNIIHEEILASLLFFYPTIYQQLKSLGLKLIHNNQHQQFLALFGKLYDSLDYYNQQLYQIESIRIGQDTFIANSIQIDEQQLEKQDFDFLFFSKAKVLILNGFTNKALKMIEQFKEKGQENDQIEELIALCFFMKNSQQVAFQQIKNSKFLQQKMFFYYIKLLMKKQKYHEVYSICTNNQELNKLNVLQLIKVKRYLNQYEEALNLCSQHLQFIISKHSLHSIQVALILHEISKIYLLMKEDQKALIEFKQSQLIFLNQYTQQDFINIYTFLKLFVQKGFKDQFQLIQYWFHLIFGQVWNKQLVKIEFNIQMRNGKIVKNMINLIKNKLSQQVQLLDEKQFIISKELIFDHVINIEVQQRFESELKKTQEEEFYEIKTKLSEWILSIQL